MSNIDLTAALTELINGAIADPADRVSEILNVGNTDQGTTTGLYKTKGGRELGFEVSDGAIDVFELKSP